MKRLECGLADTARLCAVLGESSDCAHAMAAAMEALTQLFDENFEAIGEVGP